MENDDSSTQLRKMIEEKVNSNLKEPISKLINESTTSNPDELIKKLDLKSIEDDVCHQLGKSSKTKKKHDEIWSNFSLDCYDYAAIIDNLNGNTTIAKLKALDELLNIQIIDTKHKQWNDLSQGLRKCYVSANNEIFSRALRVHHKVITFPNSSCDGYLSLLQGTLSLLNSRYFSDLTKNRVLQALQLILSTQKSALKSLLHANHNSIDEIVASFVLVISFKSVADLVGVLDKKAVWLQNFCYGAYIRRALFNNFKEKSPNFVKSTVSTFVNFLNGDLNGTSQHIDCAIHCGFFLMHFLSYKSNLNFFPLQLDENREITINYVLELIIVKINQHKHPELIDLITTLFSTNPELLNLQLLDLLFQPFSGADQNSVQKIVAANNHAISIISDVAKSKNFGILFGNCNKLRKVKTARFSRRTSNLAQKFEALVVVLLQSCVDQKDALQGDQEIPPVLSCCESTYQSHSGSLYYANPEKLIMALRDFYRATSKSQSYLIKIEVLKLFNYFYSNYPQILKIIGCENQILSDLFSFNRPERLGLVVNCIANDTSGNAFLKSNYNQVVKPYLENIWYLVEKEENFLSQNDEVDDAIIKLLFFLFVVKFNYKAVMAFLSNENESTIVDSDDKTVALRELIEKSLATYSNLDEEYLGLLVVKVLTTSLDLMLYLQANHQVQEKLANLQENCRINETELIVDAHSSLRHNILICFQSVGFVNNKLNENVLGQTQFVTVAENPGFGPTETSELGDFLNSSGSRNGHRDFGWVLQARRAFKNSLSAFDVTRSYAISLRELFDFLQPSLIVRLLEQVPKTYVYRKMEFNWPPADSVYYQLYPEDSCGISTIINFGLAKKLSCSEDDEDNLTLLIRQSRVFIGHQPEEFSNFDWFVGVIYLICSDIERCKTVLLNFTNSQATSLIWSTFGKEFDASFQENFYQQLAIVLEENCQSFQALKMLGITCETVVRFWLSQCFFNILNFEEICNFLVFSILYPPECLLYYMVAIFQHLNQRICTYTHTETVDNLLNMDYLGDFRLSNYLELIEKLMKQYRNAHKL